MDLQSIIRKIEIDSVLGLSNSTIEHFNKIWSTLPATDIINIYRDDIYKPEFLYFGINEFNNSINSISFWRPCRDEDSIIHFDSGTYVESLEYTFNIDIPDGHMLAEYLLDIKLNEVMNNTK